MLNMKLADAFQFAENKRPKPTGATPSPRSGETHIVWSDAEWMTLTRELITRFPELGLPSPDNVGQVRIKHMVAAMAALPIERRRTLAHLTTTRPRLAQYCARIIEESSPPRPQSPRMATSPLPSSVVYRQPDGAQLGQPPAGARVFWRENEWYALAVELVFNDPSFLDTLNHLQPSDLFRAQRVLPTNRRRAQATFNTAKIRAELTPAVRRVRAAIDAARNADAENQAAAQAAEAERAEQARQAVEMAAQAAMLDRAAQSPEFIARALGAAAIGPLFEALMARGAASLQGMIENALVSAFKSDAVRNAMVVNLHMDRTDTPAQAYAAHAPAFTSNTVATAVVKPKIGILGALAQQGEVIAAAYPQLRIKAIDKNLSGQSLREAVLNCDRVISMTSFISHSMDAVAHKAVGDKYTRVDGGVSAVRRQIDIWLSTGALQPTIMIAALDKPTDAKGE